MSKIKSLQQALSTSSGKTSAAVVEREPANVNPPAARQPGRAGQVNISAWMDANFKASLRLVQARKGGNAALQDLMAEALNDLFTKYDVPTIRHE
jgi:hypothetical protein